MGSGARPRAVLVPRYDIPGGSVAGYGDPDGNVFYVYDQRIRDQPDV